jgi:isopropylmalate/homocitrate/citramalate synthase
VRWRCNVAPVSRTRPLLFFPRSRRSFEEITGIPYSGRKAVIGRDIFRVESGIHIDGIMKRPQMYDPFSPSSSAKIAALWREHSGGSPLPPSSRTRLMTKDFECRRF